MVKIDIVTVDFEEIEEAVLKQMGYEKKPTICFECKYFQRLSRGYLCKANVKKVTDYVSGRTAITGYARCRDKNKHGKCKDFKKKLEDTKNE